MNFLHSRTVAIDQSRGSTPGEGSEPVPVSVYMNEPLPTSRFLHHIILPTCPDPRPDQGEGRLHVPPTSPFL